MVHVKVNEIKIKKILSFTDFLAKATPGSFTSGKPRT
jgi:hypothetical protein